MIISITIEDRSLLKQILNDLGKEKLLEIVEELDNEVSETADNTPEEIEPDTDEFETPDPLPECYMQEVPTVNNDEPLFNGECRYNPDTPCEDPVPEDCASCPRHSC